MHKSIALINGQTINLRPPQSSDARRVFTAVVESQIELQPWMPWCHAEYCEKDTADWIEVCVKVWQEGTEFHFIMLDDSEETCLGSCGLNNLNSQYRSASLGYWVHTRFTGLGIATASARSIAKYGFVEQALIRIEIVAALENYKSQQVAVNLGATHEGIKRNGLLNGEEPAAAAQYSLIPSDLR